MLLCGIIYKVTRHFYGFYYFLRSQGCITDDSVCWCLQYASHCLLHCIGNRAFTRMHWWLVKKWHSSTYCRACWTAEAEWGVSWVRNRAQIESASHIAKLWSTPIMKKQETVRCKNCTRWMQHHTSYPVPTGHPLISCVCLPSLVARRGKEHYNEPAAQVEC